MTDDEDEGGFGGLFEDGHWVWDETAEALVFKSDLPPQEIEIIQILTKAPTGTIEFRDDVDLIEQDVKDIALYTAPVNILSPMLINMLHLPTTERFIRALILFCSYYLQIADEMANRILEMETKVRTPDCEILEHNYRDNLADMRLLVAKEYCTMLIGGGDTKKFHHMGPLKKRRSLSDKDARLIETLLRMCVQIVWLALGRKSFNQIVESLKLLSHGTCFEYFIEIIQRIPVSSLEVNRVFKSEIFNAVEHNLKTGYIAKMAKEERDVLLGHCVRHDKKLNTRSPLLNEVFCHRQIDYRLMGLGVIKTPKITPRLQYMLSAVAAPEERLKDEGVVLGIIGLPRAAFDTMLRPLPTMEGKSRASMSSQSGYSSRSSVRKSMQPIKMYPDIMLPRDERKGIYFPPSFPSESETIQRACSETQRRRWLARLHKLTHPTHAFAH